MITFNVDRASWLVAGWVLVIGVLLVAVGYVPPLAQVAHLEPFPPRWWIVVVAVVAVVAVAAVATTWSESFKTIGREPA